MTRPEYGQSFHHLHVSETEQLLQLPPTDHKHPKALWLTHSQSQSYTQLDRKKLIKGKCSEDKDLKVYKKTQINYWL